MVFVGFLHKSDETSLLFPLHSFPPHCLLRQKCPTKKYLFPSLVQLLFEIFFHDPQIRKVIGEKLKFVTPFSP